MSEAQKSVKIESKERMNESQKKTTPMPKLPAAAAAAVAVPTEFTV